MKTLRILLVEDDLDHQVTLKEVLEDIDNYAIKLSIASSGAEGLEKMRKGDFDLVITDYHMPQMSGLDLLRVTTEENIDVPIIMITGSGDEKVAVQAMKMGACDYVPKDTVTPDSLNVIITRALERHEAKKTRERLERQLWQKTKELEKVNRKLKRLSIIDDSTGVYNRRFMFDRFKEECVRVDRYRFVFSCCITDLDWFKAINDKFGHPFGDFVLKKVARIIKRNLRNVDILGRYGGDEFIILLPMTEAKDAYVLAEKVRKILEEQVFKKEKNSVKVTLSIGVASYPSETLKVYNKNQLIEAADRALYKAKSSGRNRTELA